MVKIAIIGANSYIARNMYRFIKDMNNDYDIKLYDIQEEYVDKSNDYVQVDFFDKESIKRIRFDCDIVYFFTGRTGSLNGFYDYDSFIDVNEKCLLHVLDEYKRQKSDAKFVFPSTRLVYKGKKGLLKEDDEKEFNTIYALNKFAGEKYLEQYNRVFGVQYVVFRICLPYGTLVEGTASYGTAEFMVGKAKKKEDIELYGDGSQRRTLVHIEDLCKIMLIAALDDKCVNDVFNIGGENYSLCEMATLVADKYGVSVKNIPWPESAEKIETGDTVFDSQKLEEIIGKHNNHSFCEWISGVETV